MKKKITALLLVLALAAAMCVTAAAGNSVTVRVEGVDGNVVCTAVDIGEQSTVLEVLEKALTAAGVEYVVKDSAYGGKYVSAIGEDAESRFGGYDGWMYYVDGVSPMYTVDAYVLKGGEEVLLAYADMSALLPILTVSRDSAGIVTVTVTADVTTYDENWNASVSRDPVAGVTLTVDGVEYVTDETGSAVLSADASAKAQVTVQAEKKAESGVPQVIRLAPGYTLDLTAQETPAQPVFSDVAEGLWYTPYVLDMAGRGAVTGFPDGTFRPTGAVTRAQVVNVLYQLSGGVPVNFAMPFSDVAEGLWYTEAVRWAASEGIANGADVKFSPNAFVSRQDLAVMLVRYQQKVVGAALPETAEAPAFADNDKIASYAAEAVYLLQKAGSVTGSEGRFNPTATASRGELCKMLSGLVVSE